MLGPLEVRRDDEVLAIRPGKSTEVLIRLALDAGVAVRTERLIEDLWGPDAVTTQRNTLQAKVSDLRRALGDASLVAGSRTGYTLLVEPATVDALYVVDLAERTSELLAIGDPAAALEASTGALAHFRGDVLADAGEGEWLVPHRVRLEEVRLRLLEDQVVARMALGAAGEVIPALEALVASHPLREGLWVLLITALYRDGRQADALATYRRVRELLVEELGVDPGPELQALEHQVLLHDRALASTETADRPSLHPGALPATGAALVGRARELKELSRLIGMRPVVTVVGPAGVGKTRLAVEAARRASPPGRTWFARLETATDAASLAETVGAALQVPGATAEVVVERLRDQTGLLVLDRCEHLLEATAALVDRIAAAAPQLRVLVTGQAPLGLPNESRLDLAPLPVEDAVDLFLARAAERRPELTIDGDTTAAIEELCRSLDGLPLAIELAAARTKVLSVHEIARRLDDRFALLRDPERRGPEHARALDAAIGWSYDLLFPDEQRGLWALACFADGARPDALEPVLAALDVPVGSAADLVPRLAERSLVVLDDAPGATGRVRLLDSVRMFAAERLDEAGLTQVARRSHAEWFATAADAAADGLHGPDHADHLELVREERANVEAALAWTATDDPAVGVRIANGFGWAWLTQGDGVVGAARLRAALDAAPMVDDAARADALALVAWLEAAGDLERAQSDVEQAVELAARADDRVAANVGIAAAFVRAQLGPPSIALEHLDRWRTEHPAAVGTWAGAVSWILTAHAGLATGDVALARRGCADAHAVLAVVDDGWAFAQLEGVLGFVAQAEQRYEDAVVHLTRAADVAHTLGFATEGFHLAALGRVLQQAGDDVAAINTLERAIEIGQRTGELRVASLARVRLGRVLRGFGDREGARVPLTAAAEWYRAAGAGGRALASRDGAALATCLLAAIALEEGDPDAAEQLVTLLERARADDDVEIEVLALDALARDCAANGDDDPARRLLAEADARAPEAALWLDDADRLDAHAVRTALGVETLPA